jgi:hypothetical protein
MDTKRNENQAIHENGMMFASMDKSCIALLQEERYPELN